MCEYLGVEVPEGRLFPRLSDCEEFPRMMRRLMTAPSPPRSARWLPPRPRCSLPVSLRLVTRLFGRGY